MTYDDLKLMVDLGKRPLVCFTKAVFEQDSQFEEGMMAEVISLSDTDLPDLCEVVLSEEKFQTYNKNLERPIWYDSEKEEYCLKFSEQDTRTLTDSIFEKPSNIECFVLKDGNMDIFKEFLDSKSDLTYVEWLEENLSACRALLN